MKRLIVLLLLLVGVATADSNVSKKELYSRARDVLKESLENGDTAKGAHIVKFDDLPTPRAISFRAKLEKEKE